MGVFEVGKRGWRVQQKVSPVNRMRLIIPGITMRNMGSSFMYPHMMQPAFTCDMFLAERQRCTMTCQGKPSEGGCREETPQHVLTTPASTTTLGRQPGTPTSPRLGSPQTTGACPPCLPQPHKLHKRQEALQHSGQDPLSSQVQQHAYLVCAPVPQGDDGQPKDEPRPGQVSLERIAEDVEGVSPRGVALCLDGGVSIRGHSWNGIHVFCHEGTIPSHFVESWKTLVTKVNFLKLSALHSSFSCGCLRSPQPELALCNLGQVIIPFWASAFSSIEWDY